MAKYLNFCTESINNRNINFLSKKKKTIVTSIFVPQIKGFGVQEFYHQPRENVWIDKKQFGHV